MAIALQIKTVCHHFSSNKVPLTMSKKIFERLCKFFLTYFLNKKFLHYKMRLFLIKMETTVLATVDVYILGVNRSV